MPVDSALLAELGRATWAITLPNLSRVPARLAAPGADLFRLGLVQVLDVPDEALALAAPYLDQSALQNGLHHSLC